MFLPSGSIILIDGNGNYNEVMSTDIHNMDDFKDELRYLFDKCGYNINNYFEAIYKNGNGRVTMRLVLDELY